MRFKFKQEHYEKFISYLPFLPFSASRTQVIWHIYHKVYDTVTCSGNNLTKFLSFERGYSRQCKQTGCSCMKMLNETRQKMMNTCLERYGVDNPQKNELVKEKGKLTCLERYGVDNPQKNIKIKEKTKQTCLERYGVEHAVSSSIVKNKIIKSFQDQWGVDSPFQSKKIREKSKQTCLERYGVSNIFQSTEFQNKRKEYLKHELGIEHINQINLLPIKDFIYKQSFWDSFESVCNIRIYLKPYLSESVIYQWIHRFRPDLIGLGTNISLPHQKIINFLKEHQIDHEINSRKIISPMELDIFIPSKNLAIEVNGIYWHSEIAGNKPPNYHLNKTLECEKHGIRLLQFWDTEILEKWDIVSSMFLNRLGITQNKIYARKCQIITVSKDQEKDFLNYNHLQGYSSSSVCLGLIYQNELVSLMSFRTPRYNKKYTHELVRFVNKINTQVIGGASKLFKSRPEGSIVSYSDRRYSQGQLYDKLGMTMSGYSAPSYHYTDDYISLVHRSNFRKNQLKSKLKSFDPSLTEWQNMVNHGYDRVWDCGTQVYSLNVTL